MRILIADDHALVRAGLKEALTELCMEQLTPRQRQVLVLMCAGRSNKMIARDLGLSEFTVKAHVAAILRTLDVSNRLEAANMAHKLRRTSSWSRHARPRSPPTGTRTSSSPA
jgi:DNA-binding NarL/FixJ family response regulator